MVEAKASKRVSIWEWILIFLAMILLAGVGSIFYFRVSLSELFLGISLKNNRVEVASLVQGQGEIKIRSGESLQFESVKPGSVLRNQDTIVTDESGSAIIRLKQGGEIRMGPRSMLKLDFEEKWSFDGIARNQTFEVLSGNIKTSGLSIPSSIKTAEGTIQVGSELKETKAKNVVYRPPVELPKVDLKKDANGVPIVSLNDQWLNKVAPEIPSNLTARNPANSILNEAPKLEVKSLQAKNLSLAAKNFKGLKPDVNLQWNFSETPSSAQFELFEESPDGKLTLINAVPVANPQKLLQQKFELGRPGKYLVKVTANVALGEPIEESTQIVIEKDLGSVVQLKNAELQLNDEKRGLEAVWESEILNELEFGKIRFEAKDRTPFEWTVDLKQKKFFLNFDEFLARFLLLKDQRRIFPEAISVRILGETRGGYSFKSNEIKVGVSAFGTQLSLPKEKFSLKNTNKNSSKTILFTWRRPEFNDKNYVFFIREDSLSKKQLMQIELSREKNFVELPEKELFNLMPTGGKLVWGVKTEFAGKAFTSERLMVLDVDKQTQE